MISFSQYHYILTLFLILTIWTSHVMSRKLFEACTSERHEKWMAQYGRSYKDAAEKERRFQIFRDNVEFIDSFNGAGNKPFKLSINRFADLSDEEFKASLNGQKKRHGLGTVTELEISFRHGNVTDIPATMDWRERGPITPIKDQGKCGSCWAFSTVAAAEGIHKITTGRLVSLTEQELVDCVRSENTEGCNGGYMQDAFEFIMKEGGIASEAYYPYKGVNRTCEVKKETKHVAEIKGYEKVPANSEEALLKAVANQPVSVYIDAGANAFKFYSSGIFTGKCETDTNHAVTAVGYGKAGDGTKYWLVKNSWGTEWGENVYIRMKRGILPRKVYVEFLCMPRIQLLKYYCQSIINQKGRQEYALCS